MINKTYDKYCDTARLTQEIVAAGLPIDPNTGARFYGVRADWVGSEWITTVIVYDDFSAGETTTLDGIVTAHIPTPLPPVPEFIKDIEGKLFTRAESRPLQCTTCFTTCGDTDGETPVIGAGNRLAWDASISGDWTTEGIPTGYKQASVIISFCDSIWLKEGTLYYIGSSKGSYVDMVVLCPNGYYYMYLGEVKQNTSGNDLVVDHYLFKHPLQGDVPMGDEINTETCSQELPSYLKFKLIVTVPVADVTSYGYMELELYRKRTVVV